MNGLSWVFQLYRKVLSPFFGPCCRFHPSCSRYAEETVRMHGFGKGLLITAYRLLRCHPFHPGGYDPPPRLP